MDWVRGESVGHGSFGKVNLAIPRSQSSKIFVVKSCAASNSATLLNEKIILDELKGCPQIIKCLGDSYTYENGENLYNVLLGYVSGGALSDKLKTSRLTEFEVKKYTNGLLRGLHYIHKSGFVHCDIKPQNILLGEDGEVKIADFGLAKRAEPETEFNSELRGTPLYMSPEMVTGGKQDAPADIWALGCVLAEMVTGRPVWRCSEMTKLLMKIGVGDQLPEIPEKLSEEGKDFLRECFVKDPSKRWTAEMLLKHPFVADHDSVTVMDETCSMDTPSTSPRCPFDFPDWVSVVSSVTCTITSIPSPAIQELFNLSGTTPSQRLLKLVSESIPDWSCSDDWISVR